MELQYKLEQHVRKFLYKRLLNLAWTVVKSRQLYKYIHQHITEQCFISILLYYFPYLSFLYIPLYFLFFAFSSVFRGYKKGTVWNRFNSSWNYNTNRNNMQWNSFIKVCWIWHEFEVECNLLQTKNKNISH